MSDQEADRAGVERALAFIDVERNRHSVTSELFFVLTKVREYLRSEKMRAD